MDISLFLEMGLRRAWVIAGIVLALARSGECRLRRRQTQDKQDNSEKDFDSDKTNRPTVAQRDVSVGDSSIPRPSNLFQTERDPKVTVNELNRALTLSTSFRKSLHVHVDQPVDTSQQSMSFLSLEQPQTATAANETDDHMVVVNIGLKVDKALDNGQALDFDASSNLTKEELIKGLADQVAAYFGKTTVDNVTAAFHKGTVVIPKSV